MAFIKGRHMNNKGCEVEKSIWTAAYLAALGTKAPEEAQAAAELAVEIYRARWRQSAPPPPSHHGELQVATRYVAGAPESAEQEEEVQAPEMDERPPYADFLKGGEKIELPSDFNFDRLFLEEPPSHEKDYAPPPRRAQKIDFVYDDPNPDERENDEVALHGTTPFVNGMPMLRSPLEQIRMSAEVNRPVPPEASPAVMPEDLDEFWAHLDQHGWGAEHDPAEISREGFSFLSFVMFYSPELMPGALALVDAHPERDAIINRKDPHGHHEGWSPLHWAARLCQGNAWVPALLEMGADPLDTCADENTDPENSPAALGLLHLAYRREVQQTYRKSKKASKAAAIALIRAGSDVGRATKVEGATALSGAAQNAPHLVPIILAHPDGKASVDAVDCYFNTALTRALIHNPEVCQGLLDAGADPWLSLPRPDGAFSSASDLTEKLISGELSSPHSLDGGMRFWRSALERMRSLSGAGEGAIVEP